MTKKQSSESLMSAMKVDFSGSVATDSGDIAFKVQINGGRASLSVEGPLDIMLDVARLLNDSNKAPKS